jgi:hypothetical protein
MLNLYWDDQLDALQLSNLEKNLWGVYWLFAPAQRVISALQNQFAEVEATEAETEA